MCECCGGDCKLGGDGMSGECDKCGNHVLECKCLFKEIIRKGWHATKPDNTPCETFRAFYAVCARLDKMLPIFGDNNLDNLNKHVLKYVINMGRVSQMFNELTKHELFDNLSKHNRDWHSDDEKANQRLDEVRRQLSCLSDQLFTINCVLEQYE